ncbi:MAG TPA: putative toxin-antitoxin system toxin component, PIN family [Chitinophagales bacterium]|nr:putative toxin-antitoxin system toxin component, PIN family [Chitinophagales bacterium]HPN18449.1 putative toxin-antitoxin system toxin component, PIN family [Chitinophagales bacterium]
MKTDKVVFDSNYYIHLILKNKLEELVYFYSDFNIQIFTCKRQIDEITDVLTRRKISKYISASQEYLNFIQKITIEIEIDERFDRAPDVKDNYLFDLCYTVKSYCLVTGDKPLLNMKSVNKINILSITAYKKLIK